MFNNPESRWQPLLSYAVLAWQLFAALPLALAGDPMLVLRTDTTRFAIEANGTLSEIRLAGIDRNYLTPGQPAPLVSLRMAGQFHPPSQASWDAALGRLTLQFNGTEAVAVLTAQAKPTHVVFKVVKVISSHPIELILWGPYPTSIGDIIGETVGVVRDGEVAVGIQTLNAKTLGGYPTNENDIEAGYGADDPGTYPDLPPELGKGQFFRSTTARPTEFGSVLQAYCRNRDEDQVISNWGHDQYVALGFADGGIIGSKIALFACPSAQALEVIGAIEVAEGLPHPLLDGVWGKVSPAASSSYLIVDFGEDNIERAVAMTKRAGLSYLYHSSPFETWGHFQLKPSLFPRGWEGFRSCVETARSAGVRLGFHTLSNFITPNDPYVTPAPDPRLARIGASDLTTDIDALQVEIPVEAPEFFRKATILNTVMIGEELVRYASVSAQAPWRLLECQRGAWGTRAAAHIKGDAVAKLMDHSYKVFLTDADLSREVARNIARFCNQTGARQLSFDGLEGNWSTGLGQYGRTLFTQAWYDALDSELRGQVINDGSNPGHFNWHVYTRMNWGEPWYAGFRESQTLYRFKNQLYFERNLMPRMLGWFALRPDTSLEDAEWLLARAAGFDAGFTLATSLASTAQLQADPHAAEAARQFGAVPAIFEAIRQWETARMARAFPIEVKAVLRDNSREFHLEPAGQGRWDLYEYHLRRFSHDITTNSPAVCGFRNPYASQPLQWMVRNSGKSLVAGLTVMIEGKSAVDLRDQGLQPGGVLRYQGGDEAILCDPASRPIGRVPVDADATRIGPDEVNVSIGCRPQSEGNLKIELRTVSPNRRIGD